jgi:hypothetical protein
VARLSNCAFCGEFAQLLLLLLLQQAGTHHPCQLAAAAELSTNAANASDQ